MMRTGHGALRTIFRRAPSSDEQQSRDHALPMMIVDPALPGMANLRHAGPSTRAQDVLSLEIILSPSGPSRQLRAAFCRPCTAPISLRYFPTTSSRSTMISRSWRGSTWSRWSLAENARARATPYFVADADASLKSVGTRIRFRVIMPTLRCGHVAHHSLHPDKAATPDFSPCR